MNQSANFTNATRLSAPSLAVSHVAPARRAIPDDSWAPNQLVPGTDYRIIRPLGAGGMGQVFEVEDQRLGCRRALKAIRRSLCLRDDLAQRFRDEAWVMGQLHNHPNLVQVVYTDDADDGRVFLVMELLKGCSLDHELAAQQNVAVPLEKLVPWACAVMGQVLAALGAAHAHGVLHRDVKPANVFLQAKGGIKLLDFGIAGFMAERPGSPLTQPGQLPGTPGYMPPERLRGAPADVRTDVFAAGVLLWETLTRERVASELDPMVTSLRMLREGVPSLALRPELGLPPAVVAVVDRATAYAPDNRFPSVDAFAEALQVATATTGLRLPANPGPLVGLSTAPVPAAPEGAAGPSPSEAKTREVRFELPTAPTGRGDTMLEAGASPSSVDPFAGTPPVGFEALGSPRGAAPGGAAREADRWMRSGSREHDRAYRDSPTISARLGVGEASATNSEPEPGSEHEPAAASKRQPAPPRERPSESQVARALPRANLVLLRVGLVMAVGAFGLGLSSPWWKHQTLRGAAVAAPVPETVTTPEASAPAVPEVATAIAALGANAPGVSEATAAATLAAAPAVALVTTPEVAKTTAPGAMPQAAKAVAPVLAPEAGAAPKAARAEEAMAPALALKGAGVSPPAGATRGEPLGGAKATGTAPTGAKAAGAAPTGANATAPAAARGVRKVRAEGQTPPPQPGKSGWRLKRVIKVEL
jgi:serine/threonine-protein kinase